MPSQAQDTESYAHSGTPTFIESEAAALRARHRAISPAIQVQLLLTLGLRRIRYEYMQRIHSWVARQPRCATAHQSSDPDPISPQPRAFLPPPLAIRIQTWASTEAGGARMKDLRALLPTSTTVFNRMTAIFITGRANAAHVTRIVQSMGIPIRSNTNVTVAPSLLSWTSIREHWLQKCVCNTVHTPPGLCGRCGRASPTPSAPTTPTCYLCNRTDALSASCHLCGISFHFLPSCALGRGVHPLYRANFALGGILCPECVWVLSSHTESSPATHTVREEAFRRQRLLAEQPTPTAGILATPRPHHRFRALTRLIRRTARSPAPLRASTCPAWLRDTLHAAIVDGRVLVGPQESLSLP